jgi:hypothetical protein
MIRIESDLTFSVEQPTTDGDIQRLHGTIKADGTRIEVRTDAIPAVSTRTATTSLRRVAANLSRRGLSLSVIGPDGPLMTLGAVRGRFLDRLLARSRHVRLGKLGLVLKTVRDRPRPAGKSAWDLAPPTTLFPLTPTFRRLPRNVTTTHDPTGGGGPRLFFSAGDFVMEGAPTQVFWLKHGVTTIGSSPGADLRLDGLQDYQAEIRRNSADEYLLVILGTEVASRVNGQVVTQQILRTGSRVQLGTWVMSYFREEYADHGRPYGGRIGGELGFQRTQSRPAYRKPDRP